MNPVHGKTKIYGNLANDSADTIASLVISALSASKYMRMALIVDESRRVILVRDRAKVYQSAVELAPDQIAGVYVCGRNPARNGVTSGSIAADIREADCGSRKVPSVDELRTRLKCSRSTAFRRLRAIKASR